MFKSSLMYMASPNVNRSIIDMKASVYRNRNIISDITSAVLAVCTLTGADTVRATQLWEKSALKTLQTMDADTLSNICNCLLHCLLW